MGDRRRDVGRKGRKGWKVSREWKEDGGNENGSEDGGKRKLGRGGEGREGGASGKERHWRLNSLHHFVFVGQF